MPLHNSSPGLPVLKGRIAKKDEVDEIAHYIFGNLDSKYGIVDNKIRKKNIPILIYS